MEHNYLDATLAENFFTELGRIFFRESHFIEALKVSTEGHNYEKLYGLFARHTTRSFSNDELVLLRKILTVICSDTALRGSSGDNFEESTFDDEQFQLPLDFGRDEIPF
ncbi:hypothetical protein DRW07_05240 [Alteromonas sediminis]|uniref:Uncharacterized protein n=1 Tax=Alteromonas sediminis TaxID=2259342 RepID=A0A3N5Y679_9ALTE|nr:hypothetical protein [Alteromonas sediminis]RPJ68796.1 hypothetical protein DRW07_05240 [Alteromonas sediminis]